MTDKPTLAQETNVVVSVGVIASLNSLVGASFAKSRQLLPQLSVPRVIRLSLSPSLSPLSPARKLFGSEKPKPKPKPKVLLQVSKLVRKSKRYTTIVLGRAGRVKQSNQQDAVPTVPAKRCSCTSCAVASVRQHSFHQLHFFLQAYSNGRRQVFGVCFVR